MMTGRSDEVYKRVNTNTNANNNKAVVLECVGIWCMESVWIGGSCTMFRSLIIWHLCQINHVVM